MMRDSKTLMTCREAVFTEVLSYKPFFTEEPSLVKIHSSENALNEDDKKQIFLRYIQKPEFDVESLITSLPVSSSYMFPLLCKLFSKENNLRALGMNFFMSPVQYIMTEFNKLQKENKIKYAALVFCVMNENCLSKDVLNDKGFASKIGNVVEKCNVEARTYPFKFEDALSAMGGTYVKQNADGTYSFIHDFIYEICAKHFGQQFPAEILECMSSSYIARFVKPQTDEMAQDGSPFDLCIRLHENQYPMLAKRLYRDIEETELYNVFSNPVLKHPQVCQDFIAHLKTKSYTDLFLHRQEFSNEYLRRCQSILKGSENMGEWNEEKEIQRLLGTLDEIMPHARAIGWVIYYGHNEILKFIVN
jgi:hypothetical protein